MKYPPGGGTHIWGDIDRSCGCGGGRGGGGGGGYNGIWGIAGHCGADVMHRKICSKTENITANAIISKNLNDYSHQ